LGNIATLIQDQRTGLHFKPGDATDLVVKVKWMVQHPELCKQMRFAARTTYEQQFTPSQNYRLLRTIYEDTVTNSLEGRS
jgi:glycosyltransferase involved in cell wall biosynthesis